MVKNVLLTGASGTVGYEVLQQLAKKPEYRITVLAMASKRSNEKLSGFKNVDIVYGDITSTSDVERVCKNQDIVIHLAAIIPPLADDKPELARKVNVGGTLNLIKALEKHSPKAFLMYSSSISVYGDRLENPLIKVGDALVPSEGDAYAVTKIETERNIQDSSLDWCIFRLTAIMGNHKISKLMFHMPLDTKVEICTPADTARAFVNGIEHKDALSGKIFNLGGGATCRLSYRELLQRSFEIFGLGKLDFPPKSFAEKNFHCGYYIDGDDLEDIVHFRSDDLTSYFNQVKKGVNPFVKGVTKIFSPLIKKYLLRQSEPYEAYRHKDKKLMNRFFSTD